MMIKLLLAVTLISILLSFANSENWLVTVGLKGNDFNPIAFDVNTGDNVTFSFVGGSHDVIQSDDFGKCVQSTAVGAFSSNVNTGSAAAPPKVVWTLAKVGQVNYYCSVGDHCAKSAMYAKINVLAAGTALTTLGVKDTAAPAPPGPPAQPPTPADDLPNVQPAKTTSAAPSASGSGPANPTPISASGSVRTVKIDNHLSVTIALLLLACYFL
uniref:Umecyanin n=1 Tax=Anthurium amnicola TaxID=1678845 RepID=A0A1D1XLU1_9ARAE